MFIHNQIIDTVQGGKKQFVETFIKDESFKKELVNNSDIKSSNTLNTLLSDNLNRNNVFKLLSLYPNIVKEMGDNSDKKKIKPRRGCWKNNFNSLKFTGP